MVQKKGGAHGSDSAVMVLVVDFGDAARCRYGDGVSVCYFYIIDEYRIFFGQ